MIGWAEDALREAIEILARGGRNDIASDLSRILATIDFDDLDILRNPQSEHIAAEILEADSFHELSHLLHRMADSLGVAHVTLHVATEAPSTNFLTKVVTTYPDEWISLYINRRYHAIDPVGRACLSRETAFFWNELDRRAPTIRHFWAEAVAHGIGPAGFTQTITTERGDRLALSLCSPEDELDFHERMLCQQSDILSLGIYLSDTFSRLASESRPSSFHPSDDQIAVLRAIAQGKEETDLEQNSYQYGSYKTLKRSICELFQTRTVAQAAVLAARIGILAEAPLTKADILGVPLNFGAEAAFNATLAPLRRLARIRHPDAMVKRSEIAVE